MSDLVEFLEARLEDDERLALAPRPTFVFVPSLRTPSAPTAEEIAAGADLDEPVRKRALAEVESKRRIIKRHQSHSMGNCRVCEAPHWGVLVCNHCFGKAWPCPDLLDLAAVYAGHPEYLPEWAPEVP